jgi:hypothetical protein
MALPSPFNRILRSSAVEPGKTEGLTFCGCSGDNNDSGVILELSGVAIKQDQSSGFLLP